MKGIIAATAVVLTALALAPQAQARDQGNGHRGGQDHGRYDNRSYGRPGGDRNHGWQGRNDWHGDWHGRGGGYNPEGHRWGVPYYRPYGYRYPRYYYDRPYYGYGPRYVYPPAYSSDYYGCDYGYDYRYDYRCDDDGISLLLSLPLHF